MAILIAHKLPGFHKSVAAAITKYSVTPQQPYGCDCWSTLLLSLRHTPDIDLCLLDASILAPNRLSNTKLVCEQFPGVALILLVDKIARFNATPFFAVGVAACLKRDLTRQVLAQTIKAVQSGQRNIAVYQ